ncbi:MAG: hypothetical protein KI793_16700 [Rivularia sp. (in: Bacteria)]|nr:hypothetical protein [Rivularia sp. MS3]
MLWKFVIATLVLPCCLGIETASAALKKDAQIPAQSEKLELLSAPSEEKAKEVEAIPATNQTEFKISHHKRRYRQRHHYKRRHYQRRNYHPSRRVNYRNNYQDCPEYRRRNTHYRRTYYRQEAYPINDMIYRRHYYRGH